MESPLYCPSALSTWGGITAMPMRIRPSCRRSHCRSRDVRDTLPTDAAARRRPAITRGGGRDGLLRDGRSADTENGHYPDQQNQQARCGRIHPPPASGSGGEMLPDSFVHFDPWRFRSSRTFMPSRAATTASVGLCSDKAARADSISRGIDIVAVKESKTVKLRNDC
jgi:hypothetical protein